MVSKEVEDISYEENIKRHRQSRHEKLLRETAEVFAETGVAQVSMEKVAKEVGITKVVLYRYFKSKDELVDLILERLVDKISASDARDLRWGRKLLAENLAIIRENQGAFLLMMRHARHDPKLGHHYQRLCDELMEHTIGRILSDFSSTASNSIELNFFAERVGNFIFDALNGWIDSGNKDQDDIFVNWLVHSVGGLATSWSEQSK